MEASLNGDELRGRLKLVKVAIIPVFVLIDEDDNVTEVPHEEVVIPAAEWPTYSSERFPREVAEWQARIDAQNQTPNRAQRRAKARKG